LGSREYLRCPDADMRETPEVEQGGQAEGEAVAEDYLLL
jgi:hypothetical protein